MLIQRSIHAESGKLVIQRYEEQRTKKIENLKRKNISSVIWIQTDNEKSHLNSIRFGESLGALEQS